MHGLWSQDQEHRLRDDEQGRAVTVSLESTPSFGHQSPGLEAEDMSSPFFPRPLGPTGALWEKASMRSYTASWEGEGRNQHQREQKRQRMVASKATGSFKWDISWEKENTQEGLEKN